MMAEMPPGGGQQGPHATYPTIGPSPAYTPPPPRRGIAPDRFFVCSIPGILTLVAIGCAFAAFVSVEVAKGGYWSLVGRWAFHEFAVITSLLSLIIIFLVAFLQVYRVLGIRGRVMKFLMLGNAALWALLVLISSALILDWAAAYGATFFGLVSAFRASGAFGLMEFFALLATVIVFVLDILNVFKPQQPLFE